ncbi:hypothetical protein D3C80_1021650 [compost metagenome]
MTAFTGIADQLLDPFQVHDGYYADQQIDVFGHVDVFGHDATVEPFVEQHVGRCRQGFPWGESAGNLIIGYRFIVGMKILA